MTDSLNREGGAWGRRHTKSSASREGVLAKNAITVRLPHSSSLLVLGAFPRKVTVPSSRSKSEPARKCGEWGG